MHFLQLFDFRYSVKVTGKKSGKAVKKTLKATITVKNPALSVSAAGEVAVGSTEAIKATVKPANTKITYITSDEKIATVDAKIALTKTEVPAGIKTEVKAVTKDAKGVILGYFDLTNGNTGKGQVTTALTITKGYVQGSDVYLPAVGDTMVAKITYHR